MCSLESNTPRTDKRRPVLEHGDGYLIASVPWEPHQPSLGAAAGARLAAAEASMLSIVLGRRTAWLMLGRHRPSCQGGEVTRAGTGSLVSVVESRRAALYG